MKTKWDTLILVAIAVMVWCPAAVAPAAGRPDTAMVEKLIDRQISFYNKRTRLSNSTYRILADIGRDAKEKIRWLTENRDDLVKNTMNGIACKKIKFSESKIRIYLTKQLNAHQGATLNRLSIEAHPGNKPLLSSSGS